ncbi:MAG TPA: cation:proton antiporter [Ktedonobacteraceae bacterium]|nr:cation:proton antiporter [Ktedonobacteraceae bacterium]
MSNATLAVQFFLQLTVILGTCRIVGLFAKKIGQPQVVAEMIAGVLLGPSLLGLLWPNWQHALFPQQSMSIIYTVSQLGIVLYMFLIGVEFDTGLIRHRLRSAGTISLAGILTPLALGCILAVFLVRTPGFFSHAVVPWEAMLFMGTAISITAFPVLARIIVERELVGTSLGTLVLAAGAMNDAVAWCILALLLAIFKQNSLIALLAIGGGGLYVAVILLAARPLLRPLGTLTERNNGISGPMLAFVLILLAACAWVTDTLGIYSLFGAFILGTAMPRGPFARHLQKVLEPILTNFLLPLFFVYSGLNTRLGLVNTLFLWSIAVLILLVSSLGKSLSCWLVALCNGVQNREAMAIGSLMNARGLMELILLNIGLEQGIITPTLFTMLVLMAIVTTLMASPIFDGVYGRYRKNNMRTLSVAAIPEREQISSSSIPNRGSSEEKLRTY